MNEEHRWTVVVHDDKVNSYAGATFVLCEVFGLPSAVAHLCMSEIHFSGHCAVAAYPAREQAEQAAADVQVHGMRATLRQGDMGDYLWAARRGDGVLLRMSGNVGDCLRQLAGELLRALESGPQDGRRALTDERLFPDSHDNGRQSEEFRARYGPAMRERITSSARRMLAAWPQPGPEIELDRRTATDWYVVLNHAQALHLGKPRWKANLATAGVKPGSSGSTMNLAWLHTAQDRIAQALIDPNPAG